VASDPYNFRGFTPTHNNKCDVVFVLTSRRLERFPASRILSATEAQENALARLPQDKHRIERATREAQSIIEVERQAREAKTARLREQRLSSETSAPSKAATPKRQPDARQATVKTKAIPGKA
jgi:hypothetical protein